ncbi:MAG: SDR family NAD(P)-dependent oxidoreductase [Acidimicrobiia bacterium]
MQELIGKVAVVTGAGSGIGRALAIRFAQEGMHLGIADIDAAALDATLAFLADGGVDVTARPVDVARLDDVVAFADQVYATFGACDVLCNNAGVFAGGTIWERPMSDFEWTLGVNLYGILHGIRAFVPRMLAAGTEGHVVNTVSIAGLFATPFSGPYNVSKFAALAATECLAEDLQQAGSKIRVTALCPGIVATQIAASHRNRPHDLAAERTPDAEFVEQVLADTTSSRGIDPLEVAGMVVDAIRAERFLQLTDDRHRSLFGPRLDQLLAGALPTFPTYE